MRFLTWSAWVPILAVWCLYRGRKLVLITPVASIFPTQECLNFLSGLTPSCCTGTTTNQRDRHVPQYKTILSPFQNPEWWMERQNVVYHTWNIIQQLKKSTDIYHNMYEPWKHYIQSKKLKQKTTYSITFYMKCS